ncbi:MurR/RpiR family transcriptional regulator [Anaerotruncus rubiinfantis]|uniref:MurR/RpiR family transcriptional regulator n=1 Tax=Anaerotruncus rubiinfantis TaxID=1720200 RepID=UPI0011C7621C|nr:MurR/RpiR family transcriptional regulator [Anaerotruncus rubiinfantis]
MGDKMTSHTQISLTIDQKLLELTKTERRVADYILVNQDRIIYESITDVAEATGSSEATIIRMCRKLGYKGFQDLKIRVAKDLVSPLEKIHEGVCASDSAGSILEKSFDSAVETINATKRVVSTPEFEKAANAILHTGRLLVFGLGNSAPVAMDAAHKFLRAGIDSNAYCDNHFQMIASSSLKPGDVVLGISHSGNSRDIVEALGYAKEQGATIICLTNYGKSPITRGNVSDIRLFTSAAETKFRVHGLTSRIAQLAIIDALFIYVCLKKGEESIKNFEKVDQSLSLKKY